MHQALVRGLQTAHRGTYGAPMLLIALKRNVHSKNSKGIKCMVDMVEEKRAEQRLQTGEGQGHPMMLRCCNTLNGARLPYSVEEKQGLMAWVADCKQGSGQGVRAGAMARGQGRVQYLKHITRLGPTHVDRPCSIMQQLSLPLITLRHSCIAALQLVHV